MSVRIRDLRPGDRLFMMSAATGEPGGGTLISWSVPHPIYPGLALVVWRLADGRLSLDALHPEQHDPGDAVVVARSEDERLESLRRAIDFDPAIGPLRRLVAEARDGVNVAAAVGVHLGPLRAAVEEVDRSCTT